MLLVQAFPQKGPCEVVRRGKEELVHQRLLRQFRMELDGQVVETQE
jgi:hypothetical protein